jgi:hypothetical protein
VSSRALALLRLIGAFHGSREPRSVRPVYARPQARPGVGRRSRSGALQPALVLSYVAVTPQARAVTRTRGVFSALCVTPNRGGRSTTWPLVYSPGSDLAVRPLTNVRRQRSQEGVAWSCPRIWRPPPPGATSALS